MTPELAVDVVRSVWQLHYRIPEAAYWGVWVMAPVILAASAGLSATVTATAALSLVIGGQGILRWRLAKIRSRGSVVIPRFACMDPEKAQEVQNTILKSLGDHLSEAELRLVRSIPATVSGSDRAFAARLCKRLRAFIVLSGDVRENSGVWSAYARTCQPLSPIVFHLDSHTRDITPARASWRWIFRRLTGVDQIASREYPLEFANELLAVVKATAGQLSQASDEPMRAEALLREALAVAPASRSAQVDQLRVARAEALISLGCKSDALRLLHRRVKDGDAAPELLRFYAGQLCSPLKPPSRAERKAAIDALRQAAAQQADPQHEMTKHNLAYLLAESSSRAEREEAERVVVELSEGPGHYRTVWHIKRLRGLFAWRRFMSAWEANDYPAQIMCARESSRWYSAAIRARPHLGFFMRRGRSFPLFSRFRTPPILYANARDAHEEGDQLGRARWYEWRFQRQRRRLMKRGWRCLKKGAWAAAEANFDWLASVGREDSFEDKARVMQAISLQQRQMSELALACWIDALRRQPEEAVAWRESVSRTYVLPAGVPVSPADEEGALAGFAEFRQMQSGQIRPHPPSGLRELWSSIRGPTKREESGREPREVRWPR
jgi:hypothetical protein